MGTTQQKVPRRDMRTAEKIIARQRAVRRLHANCRRRGLAAALCFCHALPPPPPPPLLLLYHPFVGVCYGRHASDADVTPAGWRLKRESGPRPDLLRCVRCRHKHQRTRSDPAKLFIKAPQHTSRQPQQRWPTPWPGISKPSKTQVCVGRVACHENFKGRSLEHGRRLSLSREEGHELQIRKRAIRVSAPPSGHLRTSSLCGEGESILRWQ